MKQCCRLSSESVQKQTAKNSHLKAVLPLTCIATPLLLTTQPLTNAVSTAAEAARDGRRAWRLHEVIAASLKTCVCTVRCYGFACDLCARHVLQSAAGHPFQGDTCIHPNTVAPSTQSRKPSYPATGRPGTTPAGGACIRLLQAWSADSLHFHGTACTCRARLLTD